MHDGLGLVLERDVARLFQPPCVVSVSSSCPAGLRSSYACSRVPSTSQVRKIFATCLFIAQLVLTAVDVAVDFYLRRSGSSIFRKMETLTATAYVKFEDSPRLPVRFTQDSACSSRFLVVTLTWIMGSRRTTEQL